jgi:teichuronic acid biosynthesis glycosyltransferase TuaG
VKEDLISIIIPVYNAEKYIKQTIKTIKAQTYKNWEAIFVDDCSKDKSAGIIKKEESDKIKLIKLKKNSGPAIARNIGIEVSKGKYICFLDADDLWESNKLEKQINFMKTENSAFSYTSYYYINTDGEKCSKKVEIPDTLSYKEALKDTRILTITAMFDINKVTKDLLKMPDIALEDMATWWKILKSGYIAEGLNEPLAYYRKVKGSRGYNKVKSAKNRWELYRRNEGLRIIKSAYYYIFYIINSIKKRKSR